MIPANRDELLDAKILDTLMDSLPFGVLVLDRRLHVIAVNTILEQRLGGLSAPPYPVADILCAPSEPVQQAFAKALENGTTGALPIRCDHAIFNRKSLTGAAFWDAAPQSVTALPIQDGEQVLGLAVMVHEMTDRHAAETDLRREIDKLTFLHEFDLALNTLDLETCMQTLVYRIRELFNADFAGLLVSRDQSLIILAADGLPLPEKFLTVDLSNGLTGWAFRNAQSVLVPEVRDDPRYVRFSELIRSEMAVPLIANGQCIGVIDVESETPDAFSAEDLKLLEVAAFSAANALKNARDHTETDYWRAYFQGVVNQTGDVIYTVNSSLQLTRVNSAWDRFARENNGEQWLSPLVENRDLLSAFSGEEQKKWGAICEDLLLGRRLSYTEKIPCHAPNKERWLKLRAGPLIDHAGNIIGIIFSTQDISEHVFAERNLLLANRRLETLLHFSQELNRSYSDKNIPEVVVELLADVLQADCVTITRLNDVEGDFRVAASHGASEMHIREFRTTEERMEEAVRTFGKTRALYLLQTIASAENGEIFRTDRLHGLLYSLMMHQGKIIGSINVFVCDPSRRFTNDEMNLLRALTPQIGLAMENARMYEELRRLATTDGLTGLVNRRQFDNMLAKEMERFKRYGRKFSILMIDLDHFKCYNDNYGHGYGDELLKKVAGKIAGSLRAGDVAARYGGDEFIILLPETGSTGAVQIARRMQGVIADTDLGRKYRGVCEELTLSIGISSCSDNSIGQTDLLRQADQALYRAKQLGRNRIELHPE